MTLNIAIMRKSGLITWLALALLIPFLAYAAIRAAATDAPDDRCVPATEQQMEFLRHAIAAVEPGNTLSNGYAVKSSAFHNVWMVAARIIGDGLAEDAIAVWAIGGNPDSPHTWLSVNGFAHQFSGIQRASETDAAIILSDDGVKEAIRCAKRLAR